MTGELEMAMAAPAAQVYEGEVRSKKERRERRGDSPLVLLRPSGSAAWGGQAAGTRAAAERLRSGRRGEVDPDPTGSSGCFVVGVRVGERCRK